VGESAVFIRLIYYPFGESQNKKIRKNPFNPCSHKTKLVLIV
jgi:hypothetical protein